MGGLFSTLKRLYLSIYNWTVFYGWYDYSLSLSRTLDLSSLSFFFFFFLGNLSRLQVLYFALKTLNESGHEKVYDAVERPLQLAQTAAVMEVCKIVEFLLISYCNLVKVRFFFLSNPDLFFDFLTDFSWPRW